MAVIINNENIKLTLDVGSNKKVELQLNDMDFGEWITIRLDKNNLIEIKNFIEQTLNKVYKIK